MLGTAAIAAHYLLPGRAQDLLYDLVRLASAMAIVVGGRRQGRPASVAWYLIGVGQLFFGLGDVTWDYYKYVAHADPFPSLADVFYLAAYPALAVGVLVQVRRAFPGHDRIAMIDAAIVATGLGLVVWVVFMQPYAHDVALSFGERAISFAYPLMDVLLLAMGARLVFARRNRTQASSLWDFGLFTLLIADAAFLATQLAGSYRDGTLIDAAFLASGVLWAASALQDPAEQPPPSATGPGAIQRKVTGARITVLFGAALIGPLLIAFQTAQDVQVDVAVTMSGCAALVLLVLLRIAGGAEESAVRNLALLTAAVGALLTLAITTLPALRVTHSNAPLRAAVETAQALIAFLVTHLLYFRFCRTRLRTDLLLMYGMGLLGIANAFVLGAMVAGMPPGDTKLHIWSSLLTRLVAAIAIAWAAWGVPRTVSGHRVVPRIFVAHLTTVTAAVLAVHLIEDSLPGAFTSASAAGAPALPSLIFHPVLLSAQLVLMVLFWLAAIGFAYRSSADPGPLTTALALGFILAGFSRLSFFLDPALHSRLVSAGDFLRVAGYLVMLIGAEREIHNYWAGLVHAAIADERARTARELHDGLVQELSFIRSQAASLATATTSAAVEQVVLAANRALDESREVVRVLAVDVPQDLVHALRYAAEQVASRAGACVRLDIQGRRDASPAIVANLAGIVREASTNAVTHGKARQLVVGIDATRPKLLRVTVSDDGSGFDPDAIEGKGGFGLTSMRQRAIALNGSFNVSSHPSHGTSVEVTIPTR